jgi:hypothetical protein
MEPPEDGPVLRDADGLIAPALEASITALGLAAEEAGAAQLARRYAEVLDTARDPLWAARWVGPLLLDTLTQLGATPLARSKMTRPGPQPGAPSGLDALRAARARQGA